MTFQSLIIDNLDSLVYAKGNLRHDDPRFTRLAARLSAMADKISLGDFTVAELPVRGKDEVSALADSFNRMRRSLERAMKMLEEPGRM